MKIVIAIIICATSALAQQIGNPTTQQGVVPARGTFAIRNARIVTVSGPDIENGTIVIRDGKIEAVGAMPVQTWVWSKCRKGRMARWILPKLAI